MSTSSSSPDSAPSPVPPTSSTPLPQPTSPSPDPSTWQEETAGSPPSLPPQSPSFINLTSPPPVPVLSPPMASPSPPATSPPPPTSPPPSTSNTPPASSDLPRPANSPPSPPADAPTSSPPAPRSGPPATAPPPPAPPSDPPPSSPPPLPSDPPPSSPPPPTPPSDPPANTPPLPPSDRPATSPPPPSDRPATSPPPPSDRPATSPPPPSDPPAGSPPQPLPPPSNPSPPPPTVDPPKNGTSPPPNPPVVPLPPSKPPPPPSSKPPQSSPVPPTPELPNNSTPPSPSKPPQNSPPSPVTNPPRNSPNLPHGTPNIVPSPPTPTRKQPEPFLPPPSPSSSEPSNNSSSNSGGGIGTGGTVAVGLAFGLLLLGVIGIAGWCIWKRKRKALGQNAGYILPTSLGSSPKSDSAFLKVQAVAPGLPGGSGSELVNSPRDHGTFGNSQSWFTYDELEEATNGFAAQNLLGEGGFGAVYKGWLADGSVVAVKQLKIGGGQGDREFRAEVETISRIHHRHLVTLVGYCISENKRLLVYDYVPNDTLHFHLHGKDRPVMDWPTRVKIAMGAARGIAYLHEDCHPRIIHRDIKSSNILLDENFDARVSDFGLAKLALDANTHVTTRVMGTFGYMAPEYASSGKLTEKSDVYSFGVVLLELITGRKPVDASQPLGDESLVEWARPLLSHALENKEFQQLTDPGLEKNYVDSEMFRMVEAAAACIRHSSAKRPRMGQVVRAFENMAMSDLTNGMRVGESEIFNSAEQSAEIRLFRRMAFGSGNFSIDFFQSQ
ncbi:unnamed protein product [Cuscuta europaea]|uniref:non-specific serine/threonine protein kinase n=1 Tax=Cuscuta europaea TaxID=41803 RepID=A0A9P0ZZD9_CUSEU|nr:unnamed protein product [Cuscuta europaea]